ncbi:S8 family serine peptidase [Flavobacteriaceae bacterium F08102]|nr:S8 family serine peptidase [Flavobacteriaceae bacterium F08102]
MYKILVVFLCLFTTIGGWCQEHAWVYFTDKKDTDTYFQNPLLMLSQKALDRRTKQGIELDFSDIPITKAYIDILLENPKIELLAKSKWFNVVHVFGNRAEILKLSEVPFVNHIDFAAEEPLTQPIQQKSVVNKWNVLPAYNYGEALDQIQMIQLDYLHARELTGTGMTIAVIDGGFPNVNDFRIFQRLRDQNHIKGGYNFVERSADFYKGISHGTSVLSILGGYEEGKLIGSAPDADYYLFITEDGASETPLEESLWVEAAEKADSLGVDIINSSLGYSTFDDSRYNYTYSDMDGKTTFITKGADMAFSKGMIVVNSAGNEGNKTWHYITAPADGMNVLSVGAVDSSEHSTTFSSYGPSADGRVKPDISAKGGGTTIVNGSGVIGTGSGTSYSSPVIAGAVACLWQAFPEKSNMDIGTMIRTSSDRFHTPTDQEGYGVPNFKYAYETLGLGKESSSNFDIFPNPVKTELFINHKGEKPYKVNIFDLSGRKLLEKELSKNEAKISVAGFKAGIYILQVNHTTIQKFIKQ